MIINVATLTAEQGYPYDSVYASSKAAVALLSESLNIELAEFGVIVRAVLPGMSATRIFTKIDRGDSIPDAYQAGIARFFASNSSTDRILRLPLMLSTGPSSIPTPRPCGTTRPLTQRPSPGASRSSAWTVTGRSSANAVLSCPSDPWKALMAKPEAHPSIWRSDHMPGPFIFVATNKVQGRQTRRREATRAGLDRVHSPRTSRVSSRSTNT